MNLTGAIVGGFSLGLFMAISVGPTLFAVIKYSIQYSYRAGLAFVLGVSLSDIMYVVLANLAAPWLQALHRFEKPMAIIGGALLAILGLAGLLSRKKPASEAAKELPALTRGKYLRIFGGGFLINTINPGVIVNWLAAVTVIASQGVAFRAVFFVVCLSLVLGIDFGKVFLADRLRLWLTPAHVRTLQKVSALCLFGAGIFLIVAATVFGWIG